MFKEVQTKMENFINLSIARIMVIEVPIIEDWLY